TIIMPPQLPIETIHSIARLLAPKDPIQIMASCKSFYASPPMQSTCYSAVDFSVIPLPTISKYAPMIKKAKIMIEMGDGSDEDEADDTDGSEYTDGSDDADEVDDTDETNEPTDDDDNDGTLCLYKEIGSKLTNLDCLLIKIINPANITILKSLVQLLKALPHPEHLQSLWISTHSEIYTTGFLLRKELINPLRRFTNIKRAALDCIFHDQMKILKTNDQRDV
ncbi:hypothetical protein HDU97_004122, partial [Phlyctochytrium planicorne]